MKILIAEDDPISRTLLQMTLTKWGYEVVVAMNGRQALEGLSAPDAPKLAVLDWMMPEMDGPTVCRHVRQLKDGEYFYLLLLTAKGTKDDIVFGLESGADDYIIKPFNKRELQVRVRCGERIVKLQSELLAARDALEVQATHDVLTGLLNRGAVFDALKREQSRSERDNTPLALVMVDLDRFKTVNDTHGHAAGDCVLRECARRMRSQSRVYDHVGRYGGEEFLIVLPNTASDEAFAQAERIRLLIAQTSVDVKNVQLPITASLGVASTDQLGPVTADRLIQAADEALYQAKKNGRNRVEVSSKTDCKVG